MCVNRVTLKFCYPALHCFNSSPHSSRRPSSIGQAYAESSTSIGVVWQPPPENKRNGRITYYKVGLALAVMVTSMLPEYLSSSNCFSFSVEVNDCKWLDYDR